MKPILPDSIKKQNKDKQKSALQHLKELHLLDNCKRYPHVPGYARSVSKYKDTTANGLTKCITAFIRLSGGQAERIGSSGRPLDHRRTTGQIKWIKGTGSRGTADISATIRGLSVKIEVKIGRDRQSEDQKAYQSAIVRAGGIYYIASDFQSFYDWYNLKFGNNER